MTRPAHTRIAIEFEQGRTLVSTFESDPALTLSWSEQP